MGENDLREPSDHGTLARYADVVRRLEHLLDLPALGVTREQAILLIHQCSLLLRLAHGL